MSEDARKKQDCGATEMPESDTEMNSGGETKEQEACCGEENCCGEETCEEASDDEQQKEADGESQQTDPEEEALNIKYLRLMADFQNFKRRAEKEKSDIYAFANEKIISELLNVIDNFERALDAGDASDSFYQGMEMILKQLLGVLEKAGASEIKALGEDFDPNFHNAVMMEDSSEYDSGKVTEVLQKGYILNNRVIRPSMVKVAN